MNQLTSLRQFTTVVADTGDIDAIKQYQPTDATTNPSLVLKAAALPQYANLVDDAVAWAKTQVGDVPAQVKLAADKLAIAIGREIADVIPGRISTEVDARLSFDQQAMESKARQLIAMYAEAGLDKERILIKIAATWEGIKAAENLEKEGINCNLTLLFSFAQARACAEAGVYLISPFVGRILDWYKKSTGQDAFPGQSDPGVQSVTKIYNYYKEHGYQTVVMGASFRNIEEIIELTGCDRLTIAPSLLQELADANEELTPRLVDNGATKTPPAKMTEEEFRWQHNEDAMANEKLAEGIRNFAIDQDKLESQLLEKF